MCTFHIQTLLGGTFYYIKGHCNLWEGHCRGFPQRWDCMCCNAPLAPPPLHSHQHILIFTCTSNFQACLTFIMSKQWSAFKIYIYIYIANILPQCKNLLYQFAALYWHWTLFNSTNNIFHWSSSDQIVDAFLMKQWSSMIKIQTWKSLLFFLWAGDGTSSFSTLIQLLVALPW